VLAEKFFVAIIKILRGGNNFMGNPPHPRKAIDDVVAITYFMLSKRTGLEYKEKATLLLNTEMRRLGAWINEPSYHTAIFF
jgi:hypothetical protein